MSVDQDTRDHETHPAVSGEGIGARVRRKEDARHLMGRGRFAGDIRMPGMSDVAFLRSPVAHARILAVTKPQGREGEVFTSADCADVADIITRSTIPGYKLSAHPPLARDKVRFVGDIVAMAYAPTRAEAEDICEATLFDYEELPAIVDCDSGRAPGAALLHEAWGDNLFLETSFDSGGIEEVARTAAVKVEKRFRTGRQCMHPMEGKGLVASWDFQNDTLVVNTSTQVPHMIRAGLAETLGLPEAQIRIAPPDVGGGFGYKCLLQPEEVLVAWLAMTLKRPFRWIEDRREHLTAGANAREHEYVITAYADARGKLLALDAEVAVNVGAYSVWPFTACLEAAQAGGNLPGPYIWPHYRCKTYSVATNKPPFAPYRGVARPGVCFAMELTIDAVAAAVGREAVDVRAENLVPASAMPYLNITKKFYDSGDYPASLATAREMIGFDAIRARQQAGEKDGRRIGVGFSTYTEQSAHGTKVFASWGTPLVPGYEQATIRLNPDGSADVKAGIHTIGQGLETTLAQVASEILTLPIAQIRVTLGDTATTPFSTGAYASRGMVMAGGAVSKAAQKLAEKVKALAAHLMQCAADQVRFEGGVIHGPTGSVTFAEIARAWYRTPEVLPDGVDTGGLEVTEGYKPDVDTGLFSYATHAALVAVDVKTGATEILDYVVVEDCGRMVNPMIVEGQAYGGVAQGIGTALFEESTYDSEGQPLASTLVDYLLPGPTELPKVRIAHTETLSPFSAHGIKGVGEGGAIAPAGAIVNAINDALKGLGATLCEIPATPERVLAALSEARRTTSGRSAA
ncbi:xanthine dehydrogenase family protein molybdopterin-binding subunit [Xanthobacter sp.]|uniref:xanthine dehydrogenase family protein molybdopterin-binding subunit n=1 Tax=Xanthobacter sp. TaxID=35809 RepID=UPI0025D3339D|nr:xanthine dehydrogenase family protein molybdopterin-binding subunit [Xanthobacter sp.]